MIVISDIQNHIKICYCTIQGALSKLYVLNTKTSIVNSEDYESHDEKWKNKFAMYYVAVGREAQAFRQIVTNYCIVFGWIRTNSEKSYVMYHLLDIWYSHLFIHHSIWSVRKRGNHRRTYIRKEIPKSGKQHTTCQFHRPWVSLEVVHSELVSGLVQHHNLTSTWTRLDQIPWNYTFPMVQSLIHMTFQFVISEEGSFAEYKPYVYVVLTKCMAVFWSSEWRLPSLQNLLIENVVININEIWDFIPLSQVTLSPKPPLVYPAWLNPTMTGRPWT